MDGFDGRDLLMVVVLCSSRKCSGRIPIFVLALSSEISLAVSDAPQKYASDSLHPI